MLSPEPSIELLESRFPMEGVEPGLPLGFLGPFLPRCVQLRRRSG